MTPDMIVEIPSLLPRPDDNTLDAVTKYGKRMASLTQKQDTEVRSMCAKYGSVNVYT